MGTRHLICVVLDGEYKVAQYGQWDGYLRGTGTDILNFLHKWNKEEFIKNLKTTKFITDEQVDKHYVECGATPGEEWINNEVDKGIKSKYPSLSRDTGGNILYLIEHSKNIELINRIDFAADSLFCEWCYVIDLDKNTFEIYKGFNKKPLLKEERFSSLKVKADPGYFPVKHLITFNLDRLPSKETFNKIEVYEE